MVQLLCTNINKKSNKTLSEHATLKFYSWIYEGVEGRLNVLMNNNKTVITERDVNHGKNQ